MFMPHLRRRLPTVVSMFNPRLRHMFLLMVMAHVCLAAWPMVVRIMPRLRNVDYMCQGDVATCRTCGPLKWSAEFNAADPKGWLNRLR